MKLHESAQKIEDLLMKDKVVILYFTTPNCTVCHAFLPKLRDALASYEIDLVKVDAFQYPELAGQHRVFTVPTVIVWAENKEMLRESRFIDLSKITRLIDLMQE